MSQLKEKLRTGRHKRIRKHLRSKSGCPRVCVHRSLKNLYLQAIDDSSSRTILSISTQDKEIKNKVNYGGNVKAAGVLGEVAAAKLKQKGINTIVFDRGGYNYHGRVKALVENLRKGGISF